MSENLVKWQEISEYIHNDRISIIIICRNLSRMVTILQSILQNIFTCGIVCCIHAHL